MKKLSAAACLVAVFLLFSGCSHKDEQKQAPPHGGQAPAKSPVGC